MSKEIERKFLVKDNSYRQLSSSSQRIVQGYLSTDKNATVRVRIYGERGFLTVKGITQGCSRNEWEYEIPVADAERMLQCHQGTLIDKTRYIVDFCGNRWEIDEFHGSLNGLVIAEIELPDESHTFELPPFVGEEVTADPRYYNSNLAKGDI